MAELAGFTPQRICKAERGRFYPRHSHLKRMLAGMGVTYAALHRAQELVLEPMGESAKPIDAPELTPEEAHQAAVKLAQEAGRAVAHSCLAFMELQAGGRERGAVVSSIARQVGDTARRLRHERAEMQQQVAGSAGIPRAALSAYERGQQLPSAQVLARLLAALDCTEDRFSRNFGPFGEVESIRWRGAL